MMTTIQCGTFVLLATVVAPVAATPLAGVLSCGAQVGQERLTWQVDLDESVPLAAINDLDVPATYSVAHVQIRLAPGGPTLLIGRQSGRLLLASAEGQPLAMGRCELAQIL